MKDIYIFTGLGADERVFHKINFGNNRVTHIKWITPNANESLTQYAQRLTQQITTPLPILIGLSFGGMVAIEVAKCVAVAKIILISSAKNKSEIPPYYKWAGKVRLHKIINASLLVRANKLTNAFFSVRSADDRKIISSMMGASNVVFLNWAIDKIVHLQNTTTHANVVHIHGTADRILPFKYVQPTIAIKGGRHLMIMNKAKLVEEKIRQALA